MATFVEEIQAIPDENDAELGQRLATRIETIADALDLLEEWTAASRETRAELESKYDTAKSLARDELEESGDVADANDVPSADLLDHSAVNERTKRRLREYSTKLFAYLDEENSYREAREKLVHALDAELDLYRQLLPELDSGETSVRDARQEIAQFARTAPGPATQTGTDVILESTVDTEP